MRAVVTCRCTPVHAACWQFFLPVMQPSFTSNIIVEVYNENVVKDDLVASCHFDYRELAVMQVRLRIASRV